jgi:hypothetical protein
MRVIYANNIRLLIDKVNELSIKKDDIVDLVKEGGQWILLYY